MSRAKAPQPQSTRAFEALAKQERLDLLVSRGKFMLVVGGGFYLIFWGLDWVTVNNLSVFLSIRLSVALAFVIGFVLLHSRYSRKVVAVATVLLTDLSIFGVVLMTALLGGFSSFYYVGIIFILFVTGMFFPWTVWQTVICGGLSVASYLAVNLYIYGYAPDAFAVLQPSFFMAGAVAITAFASAGEEQTRRNNLRLRLQIEKANEELKELDKAKMRFFANVSHELRSPLTLILGPLETILRQSSDPEQRQLFEAMEANARRLLRQVNSLLDFAKIDAGKLECKYSHANLGRVLGELSLAAKPLLKARGIDLINAGLTGLPDSIMDTEKIDTIAANLLSNAIKFTPEGGRITIRAGEQGDSLWFELEDTGQGIPEDKLESIFERFLQLDDALNRRREGTGLGLAMVKELTKLHRGRVTVRSQVGQGTTFRVELPKRPDEEPLERRRTIGRRREDQLAYARTVAMLGPVFEEHSDGRKKTLLADVSQSHLSEFEGRPKELKQQAPPDAPKVLVVDDNPDLRMFIAGNLTSEYRVRMAGDGVEGLDLARRWTPDAIISDIMMPRMDGYELTRQIRQDPSLSQVPVILATSKSGGEAVAEGLEVGANDYIAKPFEIRELQARVAAQLRTRRLERNLNERDSRLAAIGQMTGAIVHDFRNPLTTILGFAEIAKLDAQTPGGAELVAKDLDPVIGEARRISRMISELLDFVRGESSSLKLAPVNLATFLQDASAPLKPKLDSMGIELVLAHRAGTDLQVNLDNDRMLRVIENIVRNAYEAILGLGGEQQNKHIWIKTDADQSTVLIRIVDDGPGLDEEIVPRLFDAFSTTKKHSGSGLGLATVRNLVVAHGGEISVEPRSVEGGAAFVIKLPRFSPDDKSTAAGSKTNTGA